ncbi:MAG: histidine kinase [Lachnospiraceae bacterium]|nr:histidine kinase [Lachnospiraceae bacterium]
MTNAITLPTYILPGIVEMVMLIAISISIVMPGLDRWSKRYFITFYLINIIGGAVFILDMITYMDPRMYNLSILLPFIEFFFYSLSPVLLTFYLLYCCGENLKKNPILRAVLFLWAVYLAMITIAQFTSAFFYTLPTGQSFMGKEYPLIYLPIILIMLINLRTLIVKRKKLPKRYFWAFLIYILPTTIATVIHSLVFNIMAINIALCIGSISMYILILTDQMNQYMRQQQDIVKQQTQIMVLQMRPHFIYNTMTSIYYLCDQDPKKAQQVILDFTTYLRKNFNAIASNDLIPFSEELEHVKAYLAVETAQFEDNLSVEYHIFHSQFLIPSLTLQPLVENAVKHGLDPDLDPLHIQIQTSVTDSSSIIIVKDNGPGIVSKNIFDTNNALSNIKQRLKVMCHGTITITNAPEGGAIAKIEIPNISQG